MNRRSGALFAAFALVFGLAAAPAARAQAVKLRLAHELPITHYGHVYIDRWAKLVKEQSKGEIEINVFPAGQLYKDADAVQALATGGLDMQLAVASYLSVVIPQARIIDLPYLTTTPYELPELLDPAKPLGAYLNEKAKEKGLNILSWWAAGDVMLLNSRGPINTAADMKGLTLRVIGGAPAEATIKTLGAEPIHLSPVELTTAVSQGTVQGFESTYSFWKLFPTMKYGTNAGTRRDARLRGDGVGPGLEQALAGASRALAEDAGGGHRGRDRRRQGTRHHRPRSAHQARPPDHRVAAGRAEALARCDRARVRALRERDRQRRDEAPGRAAQEAMSDTGLPLAGLRVLDLSRALAGPFCAMILADLGADVVKIEPTPAGEMVRGWGPFKDGISVYYLSIHRNKRSLAINFRDPRGLELIRELASTADVVVENFKPGVMEEMAMGYAALAAANPRLVFASITGFGRGGPYENWPGVDQIAQGMSGLMSLTGQAESGPTRVGIPIGDVVAGMWAALGIQAAIVQRHATGRGQRVETSLLGGLLGLLNVQGQRQLTLGETPGVSGNRHPVICPYGTFLAKDGPLNMAAATDDMWAKLCRLLGLEDMIEDPEYRDNAARMKNRDEVTRRLNEKFAARGTMEWTLALVELGLPAGSDLRPEAGLQRPARAPDRNDRDDRARDARPARAACQSDPDGIAAGSLACGARRLRSAKTRCRCWPITASVASAPKRWSRPRSCNVQ